MSSQTKITATKAHEEWCLDDADLAGLSCERRPNPYGGPYPMRLYALDEVMTLSYQKWGSHEELMAYKREMAWANATRAPSRGARHATRGVAAPGVWHGGVQHRGRREPPNRAAGRPDSMSRATYFAAAGPGHRLGGSSAGGNSSLQVATPDVLRDHAIELFLVERYIMFGS